MTLLTFGDGPYTLVIKSTPRILGLPIDQFVPGAESAAPGLTGCCGLREGESARAGLGLSADHGRAVEVGPEQGLAIAGCGSAATHTVAAGNCCVGGVLARRRRALCSPWPVSAFSQTVADSIRAAGGGRSSLAIVLEVKPLGLIDAESSTVACYACAALVGRVGVVPMIGADSQRICDVAGLTLALAGYVAADAIGADRRLAFAG